MSENRLPNFANFADSPHQERAMLDPSDPCREDPQRRPASQDDPCGTGPAGGATMNTASLGPAREKAYRDMRGLLAASLLRLDRLPADPKAPVDAHGDLATRAAFKKGSEHRKRPSVQDICQAILFGQRLQDGSLPARIDAMVALAQSLSAEDATHVVQTLAVKTNAVGKLAADAEGLRSAGHRPSPEAFAGAVPPPA
jgi:hypothetical protein